MEQLDKQRANIDKIDDEIAALFLSRMEVCRSIALLKRNAGVPVLNTNRESQVLNRVMESMPDEMRSFAKQLFSTLFETSRVYQSSLIEEGSIIHEEINKLHQGRKPFPVSAKVACQGIEGEFSHLAADKLFPNSLISYVRDFEGVFEAIEKGVCSLGVLPVQNNFTGCANDVYDLIRKHHFYIIREVQLPVKYCLLANVGVELRNIKQIFTYPHALAQCSEFMKSLGKISVTMCENTATAAKLLSETGCSDAACIASEKCASIYSLSVLNPSVQDNNLNHACFIAISKNLEIYSGAQKTSIAINLQRESGSLNRLLNKLLAMNLNLTKLESKPIANSPLELSYYFDFEADISDGGVLNIIPELEKGYDSFTYLGSYDEIK
jgi:chorismate mutase/prephenate dehydratase